MFGPEPIISDCVFTTLHHYRKLVESYKQIRNRLNNLNTQLKREYFSEKITQFQGDLKKTWKTINQVINKKSNTTVVPNLTVDGQTIRGKKAIASYKRKHQHKYITSRQLISDRSGRMIKRKTPSDYDDL